MSESTSFEVRGLRAAARITGRSPSGLQKLIDNGGVPATKQDGVYVFASADLEALRADLRAAKDTEPAATASPKHALPEAASADEAAAQGGPALAPVPSAAPPPATLEADGATSARVFELLNEGKTPVDVVIETKLAPAVIEAAYEGWLRLKAKDVSSPAACSRIDALAAEVSAIREEMSLLRASEKVVRQVVDNHGNDLRESANYLGGVAERLAGIEQYLADQSVRAMAEDTRETVSCLIARITNVEQTLRAWSGQAQAAAQGRRV